MGASASGPLRVAIIGTRGLPPAYGGYETVADYFVRHFVGKGHEVIVACEKPSSGDLPEFYRGAKLDYFPTKPPKRYSLRKIYEGLNDLFFYFRLARKCDVMYILAGLGTQVLPLVKLLNPRLKIVTNNDGIEWKREKYNWLEKLLWKSFIRSSMRASHLIIHDNSKLQEHFPSIGKSRTITAEYGVRTPNQAPWDPGKIEEIQKRVPGLATIMPGEYFLVIARLQPDNHTHNIIRAFLASDSEKNLVVVGGPSDSGYLDFLNLSVPPDQKNRVLLTGGIYEPEVVEMLRQHCFTYVHGHSAGGTNPSLLEAMASGCVIIVHNNPFNIDVLASDELSFSSESELSQIINSIEGGLIDTTSIGKNNSSRASKRFTWERCFTKHKRAFNALAEN